MAKEQPPTQTPPPPYPGYPPPFVVYPPEEPINWSEYWREVIKNRKLIGIVTATSTLIALLIALLSSPVYRAEVLLAPVTEDKSEGLNAIANQYGDLAALAGIKLGPGKDKTTEYIAALKSRSLSVRFIKDENIKQTLFPKNWDDEGKKWKDSNRIPTDWDAYEIFDKNIRSVNVDVRTGLITLTIDWNDPLLAAKWANRLVNLVNTRLRTEAIEDADKSIEYLEKQLITTSSMEVQQSIYRLIETQTKKKMVASTRVEYAFTVIDPAVPPERKVRPKRLVMIAIGVIGGILISAVVIFIRRRFKNTDFAVK
ncbi:MAG: Wzz/FepE/Etk N-terminal domain-containing protein [Gammaproteobacteria bacterium]|nr:Wzz/FepE/Etk N-terminal domain-containing protein [Gammaproteobacteria bacterium]